MEVWNYLNCASFFGWQACEHPSKTPKFQKRQLTTSQGAAVLMHFQQVLTCFKSPRAKFFLSDLVSKSMKS